MLALEACTPLPLTVTLPITALVAETLLAVTPPLLAFTPLAPIVTLPIVALPATLALPVTVKLPAVTLDAETLPMPADAAAKLPEIVTLLMET